MLRHLPRTFAGFAGLAVLMPPLAPVAAHAQDNDRPAVLEEVTVTARKRAESIQDVPLTVQAFTAAQIEERGVASLAELSKYSPGLTFTAGTTRASSDFTIRGMGQLSAPGDNRRDLVTIFIDGVPYLGNPSGVGAEDLERVEVIKGPQSALFGRATFGGAVSLVTSVPGDRFKGKVSVTGGTYGDRRVSGAIEGPIVPGLLAGRLVADAKDFDGFYRNALGGRLGETQQRYYAGSLNFTPVEDVSLRVRYSKRHDRDGEAASTLTSRWPMHNCGPFPGYLARSLNGLPPGFTLDQARKAFCGEIKTPSGPFGINTQVPPASVGRLPYDDHGLRLDEDLLSGNFAWTFLGGHALTVIASAQNQNIKNLSDFERTAEDRYQLFTDTDQHQETYELRLTSPGDQRLQWMVGAARIDADYIRRQGSISGTLFGATAGGPAALVASVNNAKTDSVFGSLGFDVTEALNLSVEARRQKDTITTGIGLPTQFAIDTPATLPRVLVRYRLNEETNLFANYAKGNQPTQGYATFFQLTPAQQAVALANGVSSAAAEATVKNYEIGFKHRATDGRWYLNASVYYLEWADRQGVRSVQVDLNGDGVINVVPAPVGEVFNAVPFSSGDSNTRGVDVDGAVSVADRWTLGGAIAYADTTITRALNETIPLRLFGRTDSKGYQYPYVPKLSGSAFAQYEAPLAGERRWFARTDVTYIGKRYDSIANLAWAPPQVRTNLRGGVRTDRWSIEAFVNNLFDDKTLEAARYNSDSAADPLVLQLYATEAVLPQKRHFGVTATVRF